MAESRPGDGRSRTVANALSEAQGGRLLGRLTHSRAGGASLKVQAFVDITRRLEPVANYDRRTFDIDTQYHALLGERHDLVAGGGYRFFAEHSPDTSGFR